jgi:hypothetical protein
VAVIQAFDDEQIASRELVRSKDDVLVYHTGKEKIEIEDTGAAETILSPDAVDDIGLFAESDDFVHSFYGIGGSLHNFFSKSVDIEGFQLTIIYNW